MISQLMPQLSNKTKLEKYNRTRWYYTTGYLLDFSCFGKIHRLIAADLSKQKSLDADPRAIQQIIFTGKIKSTVVNTRVII